MTHIHKIVFTSVLLALILAACTSAPAQVTAPAPATLPAQAEPPSPQPSALAAVLASTPSPVLTATSEPLRPTASPPPPAPTLDLIGLPGVPVPGQDLLDSVIAPLAKTQGVPLGQVQVKYTVIKDINGHALVVALDQKTDTPLLLAAQAGGQWAWEEAVLKTLARKAGLETGTAGDYFDTPEMPAGMEKFIYRHYGSLVTGWDLVWSRREPQKGQLTDWRIAHVKDMIRKTAANGGGLIAGGLIYWEGYPDWLVQGNYSPEELQGLIRQYFATIKEQFPQMTTWIVLNEYHPLSKGWHGDDLQVKLGYLPMLEFVFKTAQEINPGGVLILSDSHNLSMDSNDDVNGALWQENKNSIEFLKSKGIQNLAVGMHMHLDATHPPKKEAMVKAMQNLGVPVYITELDVNVKDIKDPKNPIQAQIYGDVMSACLESGVCKYWGTWGSVDGLNWLQIDPSAPGYSKDANPTLFDPSLNPKTAYDEVLRRIYQHLAKQ